MKCGDNRKEEKHRLYKKRGSRGGSTATIKRGEAEAIQEPGIPKREVRRKKRGVKQRLYKKRGSLGGQYGDNTEPRSKGNTRNGDPEG